MFSKIKTTFRRRRFLRTSDVVYNVFKQCEAERTANMLLSDLDNVYQRTSDMTGKSVPAIKRIQRKRERNRAFNVQRRAGRVRPITLLESQEVCAIRQEIQKIYINNKEVPTMKQLLQRQAGFMGSKRLLRQAFMELGYAYNICFKNRTLTFTEKERFIFERERYLKEKKDIRNVERFHRKDVIYVGEAYVNQSFIFVKCWEPCNGEGEDKVLEGEICILFAGSEKGFIPDSLSILSRNRGGYHSRITSELFNKWVQRKLIPNIRKPSIIVMDSAPYHSNFGDKKPTLWTKTNDVKLWLLKNKIIFDPNWNRVLLVDLAKQQGPKVINETDKILEEHGHKILKIPPFHCDLDPVEYIRSYASTYMKKFKHLGKKKAAELAMSKVYRKDWLEYCDMVEDMEEGYIKRSNGYYEIVFDAGNIEDEDDSSSSSDDYMESEEENLAEETSSSD